jgi:hypothetical protein
LESGFLPEIGELPDTWRRRKDIVNPPSGRVAFRSGLQPEIGELPDTWRRRKDIVKLTQESMTLDLSSPSIFLPIINSIIDTALFTVLSLRTIF